MEADPEPSNTESSNETRPPSRLIEALEAVKFNVREGHKQKGALTMQDCRMLLTAEKSLTAFLQKLAASESNAASKEKGEQAAGQEDEKLYANDEIYTAYRVILRSLEVLQTTGIFTIEGSVELLNWMEEIAGALDKVKDPAIRLRELKEKTKHASKEKKSSKKK